MKKQKFSSKREFIYTYLSYEHIQGLREKKEKDFKL